MRLDCWTQVGYRMMKAPSPHCKKAAFTVIVLSRPPAKDKSPNQVPFILVCTSAKPSGTKYRVMNNVERLFSNFVDDGKATIRIREPMHDLIISKADVAELRQFLDLLRKVLRGDQLDQSLFSAPPEKVLPAKLQMAVLMRRQYPTNGFPRTLERLTIQGCGLCRVCGDVLALENLAYLNVTENRLKTLPCELNRLPLRHLVAVRNKLDVLPDGLFEGRLRTTLEHLDVSSNQLTLLPDTVGGMPRLTALVARGNLLEKLPDALGFCPSLRTLDVTNNALNYLPASLMKLALDWVSVVNNLMRDVGDMPAAAMEEEEDGGYRQPLSLVDLAAQATLLVKRQRRLTAEDLPATLLERLRQSTPCHGCRRPLLLSMAITRTLRMHLRTTTGPTGLIVQGPNPARRVPMRALLCSPGCIRLCGKGAPSVENGRDASGSWGPHM